MRRCLGGALLLAFLTQTSGSALAATTDGRKINIGGLLAPLQSAITSSFLYAVLTDSPEAYAAMHVPPPVMQRTENTLDAARLIHGEHALRPVIRHGTKRPVILPPRSALDPKHRALDPLAMRRSTIKRAVVPPTPSGPAKPGGILEPLRLLGAVPAPNGARPAARLRGGRITPQTSSSSGTGIEHWWTYEERAIPGIGKAMLNVGTGNLVVSAMDVDVPEQGINLAFQRVYNVQSLHDYNGDDGGDPAIFGNRWTNDFDANIVYNSAANTITVYDIDGAGCTYTSNGSGGWVPCTGEYATLAPVAGSNGCLYDWTKTNGTTYLFEGDQGVGGCVISQAKRGHLQAIYSRNLNNFITFQYSYYGQAQTSEDVSQIEATHSDGQSLVLNFGLIPNTSINELATVTLPDGHAELQYSYDSSGNLLEVDKPGNNSASSVPANPNPEITMPPGDAPETYAYAAGTSTIQEACGPRCTVAIWNNAKDGSALLFTVNSLLQLTKWQVQGVLNFTPSDGTNTILQSGLSPSFTTWYTATFNYGPGSCSYSASGTTTMCDTDGHSTIWTTDGSDRVTQTQEWTGNAEGLLFTMSSQGWDSNNDIVLTTDANGYQTKYAYDQSGNVVEVQQPNVTDDYYGNVSPLSYYSYDPHNNVIAYCDPAYNQQYGNTWKANPGDSLCSQGPTNYAVFGYTSTGSEPYGCLTSMTKPMGYQTNVTYGSGSDQCGVGLPATAKGATAIQQFGSNPNRTPTQDFTYDPYGNLATYDRGMTGGSPLDSWTLGYDPDNRNTTRQQNDPTITAMISYSCFYPDGSLFYTETPSQHHADGNPPCPSIQTMLNNPNKAPQQDATSYQYDLDGDQIQIITHKGCGPIACPQASQTTACSPGQSNPIGTTCKYYDGLDRLVETTEPYDSGRTMENQYNVTQPYEFYTFRWMNRYIYDLSQSGGSAQLSISDQTGSTPTFAAYGNLYKTQEYLPQSQSNMQVSLSNLGANSQYTGNPHWSDVRGTSFDALDRPISKFELAYGTTFVTKNFYDQTGQLGLLGETKNAIGQITTYYYDQVNHMAQVAFSGTQPQADGRAYQYDADGRTMTIKNSMGTLLQYYNWDGDRISVTEPSGKNAYSGASIICSYYYPDGLREYVSVGPSNVTCPNITPQSKPSNGGISQPDLFSYAYTEDGLLDDDVVTWGNYSEPFTWTYTSSDRELMETDPLQKEVPPNGQYPAFQAKSYLYDSFGRVQQVTLPETFEEASPTYDLDDELSGYTASYNGGTGLGRNLVLNARGEMLQDSLQGTYYPNYAQGATYSANGTQVGNGNCLAGTCAQGDPGFIQAPPTTLTFDVRSGMAIYSTNPLFSQYESSPPNQDGAGGYQYAYDAAGRQTSATQYPSGPQGTPSPGPPVYTNIYDTENHITQTGNIADLDLGANPITGVGTVTNYGPDGHQALISLQINGSGTETMTTHWDGDTLLFATTSGPGGPILYMGKLGVMDNAGDVTILDRDQTGAAQSMHGNHNGLSHPWFSGWSLGNIRSVNIYSGKASGQITFAVFPGSCGGPNNQVLCGMLPLFSMTRSDGYAIVGGYVQGARTYDPTSGQWLTPDASAGDVNDPMSQKPFMWNNNNPVNYSDVTGYDPVDQGPDGSGGQSLFTDWGLTGTVGADLGAFGQAMIKVNIQPQDAQAKDVPSRLAIQPSETENSGYKQLYHYRILNSQGETVSGTGYSAIETVFGENGEDVDTSNGEPVRVLGTEVLDWAGLDNPPPPGVNQVSEQLQIFSIVYQGMTYEMPDMFVHFVDVENSKVFTSVGVVVPDQLW